VSLGSGLALRWLSSGCHSRKVGRLGTWLCTQELHTIRQCWLVCAGVHAHVRACVLPNRVDCLGPCCVPASHSSVTQSYWLLCLLPCSPLMLLLHRHNGGRAACWVADHFKALLLQTPCSRQSLHEQYAYTPHSWRCARRAVAAAVCTCTPVA
jgi:hypothetical protein